LSAYHALFDEAMILLNGVIANDKSVLFALSRLKLQWHAAAQE